MSETLKRGKAHHALFSSVPQMMSQGAHTFFRPGAATMPKTALKHLFF